MFQHIRFKNQKKKKRPKKKGRLRNTVLFRRLFEKKKKNINSNTLRLELKKKKTPTLSMQNYNQLLRCFSLS